MGRWVDKLPEVFTYGLAIVVIGFLYNQMSVGHVFNEDYAVYLQEAHNFAYHQPLHDMGIIPWSDPKLPLTYQSPLVYPPVLPLIYALPVRFFGYDLELFKILQLGLLLSGLLFFCFAMRRWNFSNLEVATSLLVFGLSFVVRAYINSIGSDLPFIFFFVFALYVIDTFSQSKRTQDILIWGMVAGAAIMLATDVRAVAVALLPTLVCTDFMRNKAFRAALVLPIGIFAVLWLGQHFVLGQVEAYGYILHYRFFTLSENLRQFYWAMAVPLSKTVIGPLAIPVLVILSVLALVGLVQGALAGQVLSLFTACYTCLLLVLPNFDAGVRYLIPGVLLFGAYACRGASRVFQMVSYRTKTIEGATAAVSAVAVALFFVSPRPLPAGRLAFGVETPAAQQVFSFIRSNVPSAAVLAATKFRSFHLFTGRQLIRMPIAADASAQAEWLRQYRVGYAVIKKSPPKQNFDFSDCPENPLCSAGQGMVRADLVYENQDYAVFKFPDMAQSR